MFEFEIIKRNKRLRTGIFTTPHGKLRTPELAFVATDAELRSIPREKLPDLPVKLTISNTFHTFTKGLVPAIEKAGGVGAYMNYNGVTATDSGGFQVFSLGFGKAHQVGKVANIFPEENTRDKGLLILRDHDNLLHITDQGVTFNYDKKLILFTPELSIAIQRHLGADIMFAFDECTSPLNSYDYTRKAMERTHEWLKRCLTEIKKSEDTFLRQSPETPLRGEAAKKSVSRIFKTNQALFGVIQGGAFEDLRKQSAKFVGKQNVPGFGIGGSLGRSKEDVWKILEWTLPLLPEEKPRHLLGIGQVRDIFEAVERGVDLFDCVIPTREARHRVLYTTKGKINVRKMRTVNEVADRYCSCPMCKQKITLSKLFELFKLSNPEAYYFATVHNIQFYAALMKNIREAIAVNKFERLKKKYLRYY